MSITSLAYTPPVRHAQHPTTLDYELLESAVAVYNDGHHLDSLGRVLHHLFPSATIPDLAKEPFQFVQGSSSVTAKLDGDRFSVAVPLVRLPEGGSAIAALRFVLTKLAANGQLHQPRLHGEDIHLEFTDKVSRLHPYKVIEVLRRISRDADWWDDMLIGQFQASSLQRAEIGTLTADEEAVCEAAWKRHWDEVDELVRECQRKRSVWFLNELTAFAMNGINSTIPLIGFLASRIAEAGGTFNNNDEDPNKRETSLSKFVKEMKAVTGEELRKNLGHTSYAINPFNEGKGELIAEYFVGDYMDKIDKFRETSPIDAAMALIGTYHYLLARFAWPDEMSAGLREGLAASSGKPWREAANILFEHAQGLVERFASDEDEDDDEEEDGEEEAES